MVHSHQSTIERRHCPGIKEFCFPSITNSVEVCKQLSSLNCINAKLKSKQISNLKLLECAIY